MVPNLARTVLKNFYDDSQDVFCVGLRLSFKPIEKWSKWLGNASFRFRLLTLLNLPAYREFLRNRNWFAIGLECLRSFSIQISIILFGIK